MIFSRKKEELLEPYSTEQCGLCNTTKRRNFIQGDFVFKLTGKCTSCNQGQMMITKIYGVVK